MTDESLQAAERRLAHDRNEIGETLSVIQNRLSPQNVADQALRYLKYNGGDMAMDIGRRLKDHPVPLIVTGVGLAWLIGSTISSRHGGDAGPSERSRRRAYGNSTYGDNDGYGEYEPAPRGVRDPIKGYGATGNAPYGSSYESPDESSSLSDRAHAAAEALQQFGDETAEAFSERVAHAKAQVLDIQRQAGETVSDFTQRVEEKMSSLTASAKRRLHDVSERATDMARRARHQASDMRDRATDAFQDQPLAAVAVGVAVGALLGALIPISRREQKLLGPYGDDARQRVRAAAHDLGDKAEHIAADAAESAVETLDDGVRQTVQAH
jgi:ElaB/YqjD/DUF883 family membrane-anchored ribosome-binding protein